MIDYMFCLIFKSEAKSISFDKASVDQINLLLLSMMLTLLSMLLLSMMLLLLLSRMLNTRTLEDTFERQISKSAKSVVGLN